MIRFHTGSAGVEHLLLIDYQARHLSMISAVVMPSAENSDSNLTQAALDAYLKQPGNGKADLSHQGRFFRMFSKMFEVRGKLTLNLDGPLGLDEWVDYSYFSFNMDSAFTPVSVVNRVAETQNIKTLKSARYRDIHSYNVAMTLRVPFAVESLLDCDLDVIHHPDRVPVGVRADETDPGVSAWESFPRIKVTNPEQQIAPDGSAVYQVQLVDAAGNDIEKPYCLKLESDNGYIPYRRLALNEQGQGSFKVMAMGLESGDCIKVKFNTTHVTAISTAELQVS